ncbi:MAG: ABC transporter substrate-binding protein [Oscillospiraceae bacterium]|nr:ABC transporter substrate-binding protein [Oscillospiraceae bacterium]
MKARKILSLVLAVMLVCLGFTACGGSESSSVAEGNTDVNTAEKFTVGICQLTQHVALDAATQGFKDAIIAAMGEENVEFIYQSAQGDSTLCSTIINDFVTKKVDLILANATPALQAAYNGTTEIPVLGTAITEYGTALNIENFGGTVGGNVSGTSDLAPLDGQADMILEIFPEAKKVALLYCSAEANSYYQVKEVAKFLNEKNIETKEFTFADSNDAASVTAAAAAYADVIYVPTDNKAADAAPTIYGAADKTPIIAGEEGLCTGCGVATLSISYYDLGTATGDMAVKILKDGADISTMPVEYAKTFTKKYNKAICGDLNIDTAKLEEAGYVAIEG